MPGRRIAFPRRFPAQWPVIRLISITVAGAAPDSDVSSPVFPLTLGPADSCPRAFEHLTRSEA